MDQDGASRNIEFLELSKNQDGWRFFIKAGLDRKQVTAPVKINKEKYENRAFLRIKILKPIVLSSCVYCELRANETVVHPETPTLRKIQKLSHLKRPTSDFQYFLLSFSTFSYILLVLKFQPFVSCIFIFNKLRRYNKYTGCAVICFTLCM